MALFSLKKIAALAAGKQPYLRGVALYNAGAVTGLSTHTDGTYADTLTARVLDRTAGDTFSVEVGFMVCSFGKTDPPENSFFQ
jgi:hypothetical protein